MSQAQTDLNELAYFAQMLLKEVEEKKKHVVQSIKEAPTSPLTIKNLKETRDKAIRYRDWKRRFCNLSSRASLAKSVDKLKDIEAQWNNQKVSLQLYDLRLSFDAKKFVAQERMGRTHDSSNAYNELSQTLGESSIKGLGYQRSLSHDATVNNSKIETSKLVSKDTSIMKTPKRNSVFLHKAMNENSMVKRNSYQAQKSPGEVTRNRRSGSPCQSKVKVLAHSQTIKSQTDTSTQETPVNKKPFLKRNSDAQRRMALAQRSNSNYCFSTTVSQIHLTESTPASNDKTPVTHEVNTFNNPEDRIDKSTVCKESVETPKKEKQKDEKAASPLRSRSISNIRPRSATSPQRERSRGSISPLKEQQIIASPVKTSTRANQGSPKPINLKQVFSNQTKASVNTKPSNDECPATDPDPDADVLQKSVIQVTLLTEENEGDLSKSPSRLRKRKDGSISPIKLAKVPIITNLKGRVEQAIGPELSEVQRAPRSSSCNTRRSSAQSSRITFKSPRNDRSKASVPQSSRDVKKPIQHIIKVNLMESSPKKRSEEQETSPQKKTSLKNIVEKAKDQQSSSFNREKVIQGILQKLEKEKQKCKLK